MYHISDKNPTKMYLNSLKYLQSNGEKVVPRGKPILEIRPAVFEFQDPYNRITFVNSRRINPFFQIAESLWILSGEARVDWIKQFNSTIDQFSDDGVWFNAPYGERIRFWNKNSLHSIIINPIDQLTDAYLKLKQDLYTRQAVVVISNPMFDNSSYTINESGRDIACNLCFTFKIRNNALHMTVFNRSNDLHWGLFGANLCQFTTIQEVMLNWLRNSDVFELKNLKMGTYTQITDSLHIYLDDYGSKITQQISDSPQSFDLDFNCACEPRMSLSYDDFGIFLQIFWQYINPYLINDEFILDHEQRNKVFGSDGVLDSFYQKDKIVDDYWRFAIKGMLAYRLVKLNHVDYAMAVLSSMENCQWKISMMYFLKNFIRKIEDQKILEGVINWYKDEVESIKKSLLISAESDKLESYLEI